VPPFTAGFVNEADRFGCKFQDALKAAESLEVLNVADARLELCERADFRRANVAAGLEPSDESTAIALKQFSRARRDRPRRVA